MLGKDADYFQELQTQTGWGRTLYGFAALVFTPTRLAHSRYRVWSGASAGDICEVWLYCGGS